MTDIGPKDILFMGAGRTQVAWYRCFLPALALQCDWIGYNTYPPEINCVTGQVRGQVLQQPDYDSYKVIVLQQPRGPKWTEWITQRQDNGVKVLFEIDDNLAAVARMKTHGNTDNIRKHLKHYEMCMRWCDGIIASTHELARIVGRFNKNVFVCEAGIDFERYQLTRTRTDGKFVVGFAGGFGHEVSLHAWIPEIEEFCDKYNCRFMCVGVDYTHEVMVRDSLWLPFTQVEAWPSVLSNFDVLLAPGGNHPFFKSKSQLKWIEASAMGIPVIGHPIPYGEIEHLYNGYQAPYVYIVGQALRHCIEHPDIADEMAATAREQVKEKWHAAKRIEDWIHAFEVMTA